MSTPTADDITGLRRALSHYQAQAQAAGMTAHETIQFVLTWAAETLLTNDERAKFEATRVAQQ